MSEPARYRVLRKIAHGGMAEIFLALQMGVEGFQKQVVLKRILPGLAADQSFVRRLSLMRRTGWIGGARAGPRRERYRLQL